MEPKENIISSQAKLSAVAGMMFFAPFVKRNLKSENLFTDEEKNFIMSYVQIWFVNLIFLAIVIVAWWIAWKWDIETCSQIAQIASWAISIIIAFSLFACAWNIPMWQKEESIMQNIQNKWTLIKSYLPIVNFSLRFRQNEYKMPYRRLKESILVWTTFIIWTLLLWNAAWIWILILIAVRFVLLLINIDIIPLSMKKAVNSWFVCNPTEVFAYISARLIAKLKKSDLAMTLESEKQKYAQWQTFWANIIIQYVLMIGILFLLYRWISFSSDYIVLFIALGLEIIKIVSFYHYKKTLPRIPVLNEFVGLFIH